MDLVIPWSFLILSASSGCFGSVVALFLTPPAGATLLAKAADAAQRIAGGGITAALWNFAFVDWYVSMADAKTGHAIGAAGAIGFGWWYLMGGVALFLDRFRRSGPTKIPLVGGRLAWLFELLGSMKADPPSPETPTGTVTSTPAPVQPPAQTITPPHDAPSVALPSSPPQPAPPAAPPPGGRP